MQGELVEADSVMCLRLYVVEEYSRGREREEELASGVGEGTEYLHVLN